jgi:hypothetical protein
MCFGTFTHSFPFFPFPFELALLGLLVGGCIVGCFVGCFVGCLGLGFGSVAGREYTRAILDISMIKKNDITFIFVLKSEPIKKWLLCTRC